MIEHINMYFSEDSLEKQNWYWGGNEVEERKRERFYKVLVTETEKPLLSIYKLETQKSQGCSSKVGEPKIQIPIQTRNLRTRSTEVRRRSQLCQKSGREWIQPFSAFWFYLGPQQIGWCPPILRSVICFYSVHQFKCLSLPETPTQTHPEIMFNQLS